MRLLVTGGGGMIGSHVAALAAARGADVHTISRRATEAPRGVTIHAGDLLAPGMAMEIVQRVRPTHLVHAAWETTHGSYWEDIVNLDWVRVTVEMAAAFARLGGRRFVQIGTGAEYDWGHGMCIEDVTPEHPTTRYGHAKLAAFRAVQAAAEGAFEAAEARIFFSYGPGENPNRLIPYVCRSLAAGATPTLSNGRQWRDLLFAEDTAAAIMAVLDAEGLTGPVNIGGGLPVSLAEVAKILAGIAGASQTGLCSRAEREGDPTVLLPDTRKLFATGWRPRLSLEQGLSATYRWWSGRRE